MMSHWAQVDANNTVVQVLVGPDDGDEGEAWFKANLPGRWVKCSYNTFGNTHRFGGTPLRGNYPGLGFTYDGTHDVFIPPQPAADWTLNTTTWLWDEPTPKPSGPGNL